MGGQTEGLVSPQGGLVGLGWRGLVGSEVAGRSAVGVAGSSGGKGRIGGARTKNSLIRIRGWD